MNTIVNFEIAKLLKEKGFESESKTFYDDSGKLFYYSHSNNVMQRFRYAAPTIADVVMWLYEERGIWISVKHDYHEGSLLGLESLIDVEDGFVDCGTFSTPNDAYESAILYCLTNLI